MNQSSSSPTNWEEELENLIGYIEWVYNILAKELTVRSTVDAVDRDNALWMPF